MISQNHKQSIQGRALPEKGRYKALVLSLVRDIPFGKLTSYGRISERLGISPRVVGFVLSGMTKAEMSEYPWFRVVDRNGFISASKIGDKGIIQKTLLEQEGVEIDGFQIIGVERYWWEGLH